MLIGSLVKATLELQSFRFVMDTGDALGLVGELGADGCYAPRCGECRTPRKYCIGRPIRRFRHVPLCGSPVNFP